MCIRYLINIIIHSGGVWQKKKKCRKSAYSEIVRSTLEYGSVVWDPHLQKDIDKIEKIQRKAARFIQKDYHSRQPGSMTKMLTDLNLPTLESRRKENRLCFMFKISKGLVPAIPPTDYLTPVRHKRKIKAKTFENCETKNFVKKHQQLNDNCFTTINSRSSVYETLFFHGHFLNGTNLTTPPIQHLTLLRKAFIYVY